MKISILSDSVTIPTGYSNQAKQLVQYLASKGHEMHFLANAYQGTTLKSVTLEDGTHFDTKLYGQKRLPYFADVISDHLKKIHSDIFFVLLDSFMLFDGKGVMPHGWFLNVDTSPAQSHFWFPSDGGAGLPIECDKIIKKFEHPVAMAKFGQKQVKDYYGLDVKHIPHGLDTKKFHRLPDDQRNQLRQKWNLQDKFVIGVVARNQPRKFLDRTIKALQILNKVKDKIPNAVLFLHADQNDPAQPFNLTRLIQRYNLENKVVWSGINAMEGFPESEMNNVFNLFDTFLLTTSGEGFGVPIIEAMACEVPVLATNYTTTPELVLENNAGLGINLVGHDKVKANIPNFGPLEMDSKEYDDLVSNGTLTGGWEVERGICDVNDAANKLILLYDNPKMRKEMGLNGRKAVLEKYDFQKVVGPMWEKVFLDSLKKR